MSAPAARRWVCRLRLRPSFQRLLVLLLVAQILAAVGTTTWLNVRASRVAIAEQLEHLLDHVAAQISEHLEAYFSLPEIINRINAESVRAGSLNMSDREQLIRHFWQLGRAFDAVGTVGFADPDGGYVGVNYSERYVVLSDSPAPGAFVRYRVDSHGKRLDEISRTENYDARKRPWFLAAVKATLPTWSDITPSVGRSGLDATAAQPVYTDSGRLKGVFMSEVELRQLSHFLHGLQIGVSGEAFIIDRSGRLVASSFSGDVQEPYNKRGLEYLSAENGRNNPVPSAASYIRENVLASGQNQLQQRMTLKLDNDYMVHASLFELPPLDWIVAVVIPRAEFMKHIDASLRETLVLSVVILCVAGILGSIMSRRLSRPIQELARASQAVAGGDLKQRVKVARGDEIGILAASFNQMTAQLERSFADLAERHAELLEHKDRLRSLTAEVLLAEGRERRRIASEVHDTTVQSLALARIRLGKLRQELSGTTFTPLADEVTRLVDDAIAQARILLYELTPPALYEVGLVAGLDWLGEQFQKRFSIAFRLTRAGKLPYLDEDTRTLLFQATRELAYNVVKHASARNIYVTVSGDSESVSINVCDDGRGFEVDVLEHQPTPGGGFGIFSIRERLEKLGGDLKITSRIGEGTHVVLTVPIVRNEEQARESNHAG